MSLCKSNQCKPNFEWETGFPQAHTRYVNEVKANDASATVGGAGRALDFALCMAVS